MFKRGFIVPKLVQNSALLHLPLDSVLVVETWTSNVKRDGRIGVTWRLDVCSLRETRKNFNL